MVACVDGVDNGSAKGFLAKEFHLESCSLVKCLVCTHFGNGVKGLIVRSHGHAHKLDVVLFDKQSVLLWIFFVAEISTADRPHFTHTHSHTHTHNLSLSRTGSCADGAA